MIAISARKTALGDELRTAIFATAIVWMVFAAAMLICAITDLLAGDGDWKVFMIASGLVVTVAGMIALATRGAEPKPTQRFGFLLVVMMWSTGPLAGAVPFVLHGMSLPDAVFEAVSGVTTTGATVMSGLDAEPPGILLWRSLMQWIGGIGILALGVVLLPFLRIGGMQLFSKESSDRSDRPLPRFVSFARGLMAVYIILTGLCFIAYEVAGMSSWDALNHALTTVATAGFSTHDASMGHFDDTGILWVGSTFMILGALPFAMYVAVLFGRTPDRLDPQVAVLIGIVALAAITLAATRENGFGDREFAEAVFNVVSVVTTSGYAAGDYTAYSSYAMALFFVLAFLGGAAGSTTGGIKTYRLIVTAAMLRAHMHRLVHPNIVAVTRYGGQQVDPAIFRSALVYLIAFAVMLMLLTMALAMTGLDLITAHSGAQSALTNVGPALGPIIGPAGNFGSLPDAAKGLLCLGMILGRLEILPVLALMSREFWRR